MDVLPARYTRAADDVGLVHKALLQQEIEALKNVNVPLTRPGEAGRNT